MVIFAEPLLAPARLRIQLASIAVTLLGGGSAQALVEDAAERPACG